jgi:diguanylate cyclase (GGDEF)-like protein
VNDTYGHDAGDIVLQTAARRLRENTRGDDTVSRHGGDEFLYMLTEAPDQASLAMIAQKILEAIKAPSDVKVRDLDIALSIGASIGIAIFPKDGATADVLIKSADSAMYRAKQSKSGYAFDRRTSLRPMCASAQMYVHHRTDS